MFYISTLSKCLAPGLRTAYLVVPPTQPLEPLLDALRAITLMPAQSMVCVATEWIRDGLAQETLQRVREELKARQALAARTFRGQARAHPHGLHVWLALPPRFDQYRLIQTALEQGLGVANSDAFSVDESAPDAIRVSLGGATDQAGLQVALEKLAEILAADRPQRTVIV